MKARVTKSNLQGNAMSQVAPSDTQLQPQIAEAAYYRAERRGFAPGQEVEDWLAAEKEIIERSRPVRGQADAAR
jgi:hypothetical protein